MRRIFAGIALMVCGLMPGRVLGQQPVRINCGGPAYTDSKGQVWQADTGYTGGDEETRAAAFTGTADPTLFNTYHWNPSNYTVAVPNGQYHVNLYFGEANPSALAVGARVFNVSLQGAVVFANLDIFKTVGANAALVNGADVTVSSGAVTIGFTPVAGLMPKINAIELLPVTPNPTLTLHFTYADGTPVAGNLNYSISSSLLSFQGSAALVAGQAQCVLFANPSSLGISAQFNVNLSLTDTAGHQLWQITLGMNPSGVNLGAVQSSTLNVVVQKQ